MSNPAELDLVRKALQSGLGGCVEWDEKTAERIEEELARFKLTLPGVRSEVIKYIRNGGDVFQIKEEREDWKDHRQYWYKAIVPLTNVFKIGLFIEMVLVDADPDLPEIEMVNAHEQL